MCEHGYLFSFYFSILSVLWKIASKWSKMKTGGQEQIWEVNKTFSPKQSYPEHYFFMKHT